MRLAPAPAPESENFSAFYLIFPRFPFTMSKSEVIHSFDEDMPC
jgi:hypothetical protein